MVLDFHLTTILGEFQYSPVNYSAQVIVMLSGRNWLTEFEIRSLRQSGFTIKLSRGKHKFLTAKGANPKHPRNQFQ